jgi:hypothetical protein
MKKPETDANKRITKELKLSRVTVLPLTDLKRAVGGTYTPSCVCDQVIWGY